MAERAYVDVGAEHFHDQKNHGEISLGKLCHSDIHDPIGVDTSTTHQDIYGRFICGSVNDDLGNLFASPFPRKEESLSPIVGYLSMIPFQKSGLGLLQPVMPANNKYLRLQFASSDMVIAVMGRE